MQIVVPTFALETVGCNVATQTEKKTARATERMQSAVHAGISTPDPQVS